jgi:hypothetical protein
MGSSAPLLAHAAAHGFELRAARTALRHFSELYGLDGEVLTVDFCGKEFLEKLAEDVTAAGGGGGGSGGHTGADDAQRPAKRRRSGDAGAADVICIASSSDDDAVSDGDGDGGRGARARAAPRVQGRIDSFFCTQNAGAPGRGGKAPAAEAREDGARGGARPDAAPSGARLAVAPVGSRREADDAGGDAHAGDAHARAPRDADADWDAMDDLALANRVCFGNDAFRPAQRSIWCAPGCASSKRPQARKRCFVLTAPALSVRVCVCARARARAAASASA